MPPKAKEAASAHAKKVEDKTFGMKNKNKSKQVQAKIQQMHKGGGNNPEADHYDRKKKEQQKAAADALDMVLFKEAKKKSEIKRAAEAACQAKEKEKEPEKRDIHVDLREQKQQDEMAGWDDEKLKRVVEQKKRGGDGERAKTDIVCKYFLDAIETKKYGWFWECPNGGDKCQYRHALPPGYVLKSEIKEVVDTTELLEDRIERERRALTTRTPVTLERLQLWLKNKQERKAEQENLAMEEAKENCTLERVETTAALGSDSAPPPSLPQPRPRAPRLILGSTPSHSKPPASLPVALPRLRICAPTRLQIRRASDR